MLTSPTPRPATTDLGFFSSSRLSKSIPSPSSSSSVVVTSRIRPANGYHTSTSDANTPIHPSPLIHPPSPSPPLSSPPSSSRSSSPPTKKRKTPEIESEQVGPASREAKRPRAAPKKKRRKRTSSTGASSRVQSRQQNLAPSPEPIYRSDRSRSTSLFPGLDPEAPPLRRRWCTDEPGDPGPSHLSSEMVVKRLMKSYKAHFSNPNDPNDKSFEPHPVNYPVAELEYPNSGASERFILLAPKDKDHYNPIMDLERSLMTIVEYYLTPEQQALFGPLANDSLIDVESPPASPSPSPPSSPSISEYTSFSRETSPCPSPFPFPPPTNPPVPLLRALKRAIHLQDGPLFLLTIKTVNAILHTLKYPPLPADIFQATPRNPLMTMVESWTETGLPEHVLMRIIDENYQRAVGPNVKNLKKYEAFSSTVYGELMPNLSHEIIRLTNLREDSLFIDLGSGVANVVAQAALQTGCSAYGIELMPEPARVAREVVEQMKIRCRMWGLSIGKVELEEGDMLKSRRVDELLSKADVVLVDNKVFEESLNEALKPKFLDLKEGAVVVSLAPFVRSLNARLTERNVDDITTIFDVTERQYQSGSVSWGHNGGSYYIHRVDREGYAKIRERFENSRQSLSRSSRSRRYQGQ